LGLALYLETETTHSFLKDFLMDSSDIEQLYADIKHDRNITKLRDNLALISTGLKMSFKDELPFPAYNLFIAGGFITGLYHDHDVSDIDVFCICTKDEFEQFAKNLKAAGKGFLATNVSYQHDFLVWTVPQAMDAYWKVNMGAASIIRKYRGYPVQFIHYDTETFEQVINTFDLDHCRIGYQIDGYSLYGSINSVRNMMDRKLVVRQHDKTTNLRIEKYKKRGYVLDE
jgi:hypothetical protein